MLVGATTENPYFEVNSALISRAQVYELHELTQDDIAGLLRRALDEVGRLGERRGDRLHGRPLGRGRALVAERARAGAGHRGAHGRGGHAGRRRGRDAAQGRPLRQGRRPALRLHLGLDQVHARLGPGRVAVLPGGDARGRRGRALHRPPDDHPGRPRTSATRPRRRCRWRSPPPTPSSTSACPEAHFALAQAAIYLALAPKSNAAGKALSAARAHIREHGAALPPAALRDAHYPGAKALGRGQGYDYPHDHPGHVNDQEHLPEGLEGLRFYEPGRHRADDARPARGGARREAARCVTRRDEAHRARRGVRELRGRRDAAAATACG